jgi:hypothetical protein
MENLMGCLLVLFGIFMEKFQMLNLVGWVNQGGGGYLEKEEMDKP